MSEFLRQKSRRTNFSSALFPPFLTTEKNAILFIIAFLRQKIASIFFVCSNTRSVTQQQQQLLLLLSLSEREKFVVAILSPPQSCERRKRSQQVILIVVENEFKNLSAFNCAWKSISCLFSKVALEG